MTQIKIALCQIPVTLTSNPAKIFNLEGHITLVEKCLEFLEHQNIDFVIFPEYTFEPQLSPIYVSYSDKFTIIGGSYISEENYNVTVVASSGIIYSYNKINLSPYEDSIIPQYKLNTGDENPLYLSENNDLNISVLTCFDYFELVRNTALQRLPNGKMIDLIFSPTCNNNPPKLITEGESAHNHRDSFYSIICNVSSLKKVNGEGEIEVKQFGKSCVLGMYEPIIREQLISIDLCDKNYDNMFFQLPDGDKIGIITIEVPYFRFRRGSMEYTPNPSHFKIYNINQDYSFNEIEY